MNGAREVDFEQRMFVYYYRLYDKYQLPIVSLAILADDSPTWHPKTYETKLWDCELNFKFVSIKLMNYKGQEESLRTNANPFATVILTYLTAIKVAQDDQARFLFKLSLTRSLYEKGWKKKDVFNLYTFIDFLMVLPTHLELEYNDQIGRLEEEKKMQYVTSAERIGIQKGRLEGKQEGKQEGRQETARNIVLRLLQRKFGNLDLDLQKRIELADVDELLSWTEAIIFANSLDDVFNALQTS